MQHLPVIKCCCEEMLIHKHLLSLFKRVEKHVPYLNYETYSETHNLKVDFFFTKFF